MRRMRRTHPAVFPIFRSTGFYWEWSSREAFHVHRSRSRASPPTPARDGAAARAPTRRRVRHGRRLRRRVALTAATGLRGSRRARSTACAGGHALGGRARHRRLSCLLLGSWRWPSRAPGGQPARRIDDRRALASIVERTMDSRTRSRHRVGGRVYELTVSDGRNELHEAIAWYEELATPCRRAGRAGAAGHLYGEAGRTDEVLETVDRCARGDVPGPRCSPPPI